MTTIAIHYPSPAKPKVGLFLFLVLFAVTVVLGTHAVLRHGAEAIATRDCLSRNGTWKIWHDQRTGAYHRLCQDDDGTIYDQVVDIVDGIVKEITAFKPDPFGKGNHWGNILQWLVRKGTEYKGPFPP